MIILGIMYALFLVQLVKMLREEGASVYRNGALWLHLLALGVVTYVVV